MAAPAMVSSEVAESMVMYLKLLPCTILMERMLSSDVGTLMICCAETVRSQANKKKSRHLMMVNFDRNGSVLCSACKLGNYFVTEW
jgi:hypothetical protein